MGFWDFLKGGNDEEMPTPHRVEESPEALGYTAAKAGPSVIAPRATTYLMASELLSDEEWSPSVESRMADIGVSEDMIPALRSLMTAAGGATGAPMGEGQARYGEEGGLMAQLMQILGITRGSPGQGLGPGPGTTPSKPSKLQYSLINPTPRYSPRAAEKSARPFGNYPGAFSWAQYLKASQRGQQENIPQLTKFY